MTAEQEELVGKFKRELELKISKFKHTKEFYAFDIGWELGTSVILFLNSSELAIKNNGFVEAWFDLPFGTFPTNIKVGFLENFFEDPFNASIEEAEMFNFEYGVKYPEVLVGN